MEASKRSREGLEAYQRLYNEFEEGYDDLAADVFREFGEDDMVRLYEKPIAYEPITASTKTLTSIQFCSLSGVESSGSVSTRYLDLAVSSI